MREKGIDIFIYWEPNTYDVGKDLKETLAGNLYVKGTNKNTSGKIDPALNVITGSNEHSFFQNNNSNSNLEIENVTLEKAKGGNIAAVLDVTAQSEVSFDNVIIRDNETTGGKASAISNAGGNGILSLAEINVLNDKNNRDNGLNSEYAFDVITGDNDLKLGKTVSKWATSVYVYDVKVNENTGKGIIMSAESASDENSLKAMNLFKGDRGFQFRENDNNYVIGSDLGITEEGSFIVKGTGSTVISGGGKSSFFDVQNETDITIKNITITNAEKSNDKGAVINAANGNANIVLDNVTLEGNKNINGKNDIYIEQGAEVTASNSSINSGLAGGGIFNATDSNLSGQNKNFNGVLNVSGEEGLKFSQTSADDSYIKGTTYIDESSVILDIGKSDTIAGNFVGDNSRFEGNLNVKKGVFALAAGSSIGTIKSGSFTNDTAINLQNTVAVQDNNGNWITNPNPVSIQNLNFDELTLNGNIGLYIDVDLKNAIADTIAANTVSGAGHFILGADSINVVSDSLLKNTIVRIADGAVAKGNRIRLSNNARTVMGPIQRHDVTYSDGNLGFSRQGGSNPSINSVNPSVMASSVATQIGGYLTQLQTLQDGFFHMNRYTKYPSKLRFAAENINKYASAKTPVLNNSPLMETSHSGWVKPYTSFESVYLKGGVDVSTTVYGALYGDNTDLVDLGHGFKGVLSTFIGYNGSQQSYDGISMSQNGGSMGATGTLYKGNFFTGLTASTGASAGNAYTYYGRDDFAMLTAGIANKTGYNWEINEGKFIIQPSLFLGYIFVNTFDYKNSAGVKMDSDPLNAITIMPGVKFIGNLKNGWQPYIGVDMV